MRHYFVPSEHTRDEYFTFSESFNGENFTFRSCPDVFSKNSLDYGSLTLVKSILEHSEKFGGKIMDMCCGYGTIAILLETFIDGTYYMSDVNSTAVELAKENIVLNHTSISKEHVFVGNLFENVSENFNHIVSNPPIKVGKDVLLNFVDGAYEHLEKNGTLTVVIKKNLGAHSLKDRLIEKFGNCEVWERDKGYYILHSVR